MGLAWLIMLSAFLLCVLLVEMRGPCLLLLWQGTHLLLWQGMHLLLWRGMQALGAWDKIRSEIRGASWLG